MNQASQQYWDDFRQHRAAKSPESVSAWQFSADPDYLISLVIDGIKTATCSGHLFYELENERLPDVGDYIFY